MTPASTARARRAGAAAASSHSARVHERRRIRSPCAAAERGRHHSYRRKAHRYRLRARLDRDPLGLEQRPPAIQGIALYPRSHQLQPSGARRSQMVEPVALALLQFFGKYRLHRRSQISARVARHESLGRIRAGSPDGVGGSLICRKLNPKAETYRKPIDIGIGSVRA